MKKTIALLMILVIISSFAAVADEISGDIVSQKEDEFILKLKIVPSAPGITVDGEKKTFTPAAFEENDRIYVPVRNLLEGLGFAVSYDEPTETVFAANSGSGDFIIMQMGNTSYSINGIMVEFDSAPFTKEDRTFVPICIMYEMLGYNVGYDEQTKTAVITSK